MHIAGHGFLYRASLNLECGGTVDATGTLVGAGWAPVPGTGATDFEIDWIVAAELMPQQQRGGGPVVPGSTCRFTMHPPQADAGFTITEH